MSGITITLPQQGDFEEWQRLWTAYLAFYGTSRDEALFRRNWAELLRPDGTIRGFVARGADGRLLGITHFMFHATAWADAPVCYLQDLYVDDAARGLGAGRTLIEAVADAARKAGAVRLYWLTHEDNGTARALYDRVASWKGFVRYDYDLWT